MWILKQWKATILKASSELSMLIQALKSGWHKKNSENSGLLRKKMSELSWNCFNSASQMLLLSLCSAISILKHACSKWVTLYTSEQYNKDKWMLKLNGICQGEGRRGV